MNIGMYCGGDGSKLAYFPLCFETGSCHFFFGKLGGSMISKNILRASINRFICISAMDLPYMHFYYPTLPVQFEQMQTQRYAFTKL
jgi:hypothetical protein